ncbi:MAG: ABC transporter permease [Chloroflexi bacterium]|nr:ABC transporter permease [Chloroflexota bacterium]
MKNSLRKMIARYRENLITLALILGFLLIWELLARAGLVSRIIFPAPSRILVLFFANLAAGKYTRDMIVTFSRVFSGFLIGGGSALVLGLIMGWSTRIRRVLDPIVAALHPIPKFALLPMVIILFGIGESSRIAMVSIGSFFPMLISTMVGVLQINPTYYEVIENYGASRLDTFRKVVLPGSLPFIIGGMRLALKSALTLTIGVEMVFGNSGLGRVLWLSWETMRMTDMYSVLLIVSIIGFGLTWSLESLKKFLIPWHQEVRSAE